MYKVVKKGNQKVKKKNKKSHFLVALIASFLVSN